MSDNLPIAPVTLDDNKKSQMLGQILIGLGKLNEDQVLKVLEEQKKSSCSFGEAAVKKKLLTIAEIDDAVARQFDYSVLSLNTGRPSSELLAAYDPFGDEAEAFRALRSQLILNGYEKGRRAISLVAPNSRSGTSYVAANLAVSIAQYGLHVCLVDTNLREPRIAEIFAIASNSAGLSEILRGKCSYDEAIVYDCFPRMGIITAGRIPPNPQELLGRSEFVWTISNLLREFDIVLFDTPATNKCADGKMVSARAGSALLVARKDRSLSNDIEVLSSELAENGCKLMGAILNDF